jgi:hypothetical protein
MNHNNFQDEYNEEEEDHGDLQIIEPLVSMVRDRFNTQNRETLNDNWSYNIFTKERTIPADLVQASQMIDQVEVAFHELVNSHYLISKISKKMKSSEFQLLQAQMEASIRMQPEIEKSLQIQINALKVFWLPENVEELFLGAYQKVRYPPIPLSPTTLHNIPLSLISLCSICQEVFSFDDEKRAPVSFTRRCTHNPLLRLQCDQEPCTCVNVNICLGCALSHLHQNGILEGKSSVQCPTCRGEFCIYDIEERGTSAPL